MSRGPRKPSLRWGCSGNSEQGHGKHVSAPRGSAKPFNKLDVSSFANPEEARSHVDPSQAEPSPLAGTTPRFDAFVSAVASRLCVGEREYGNRSFARPPLELVGEIEEELFDVCAWSFILWRRIRALREEGSETRADKMRSGHTRSGPKDLPDTV